MSLTEQSTRKAREFVVKALDAFQCRNASNQTMMANDKLKAAKKALDEILEE